MKIIGILTSDFRMYYDIIILLKKRNIPFCSLSFDDPIPVNVGVILTSPKEEGSIDFPRVVAVSDDIELSIDIAMRILKGKDRYQQLIIGIDPGKRPGIAIIGDGEIIATAQVSSPEEVSKSVERAIKSSPSSEAIIRIGHGDTTHRNRIINSLAGFGIKIEIADETRTTRISDSPDIDAAIDIALKCGIEARGKYKVEPTAGELKDIQRRSRIASRGRVTISKDVAVLVAKGSLTLEDAIAKELAKLDSSQDKP